MGNPLFLFLFEDVVVTILNCFYKSFNAGRVPFFASEINLMTKVAWCAHAGFVSGEPY